MRYRNTIKVLKRLLDATCAGRVVWISDDQYAERFTAQLGGEEISFSFLYFEACNQIGADRYMIQFHMPGLDEVFACGTEGYYLILQLQQAASGDEERCVGDYAAEFLDKFLPEQRDD
jgi:hypothetical protein